MPDTIELLFHPSMGSSTYKHLEDCTSLVLEGASGERARVDRCLTEMFASLELLLVTFTETHLHFFNWGKIRQTVNS